MVNRILVGGVPEQPEQLIGFMQPSGFGKGETSGPRKHWNKIVKRYGPQTMGFLNNNVLTTGQIQYDLDQNNISFNNTDVAFQNRHTKKMNLVDTYLNKYIKNIVLKDITPPIIPDDTEVEEEEQGFIGKGEYVRKRSGSEWIGRPKKRYPTLYGATHAYNSFKELFHLKPSKAWETQLDNLYRLLLDKKPEDDITENEYKKVTSFIRGDIVRSSLAGIVNSGQDLTDFTQIAGQGIRNAAKKVGIFGLEKFELISDEEADDRRNNLPAINPTWISDEERLRSGNFKYESLHPFFSKRTVMGN